MHEGRTVFAQLLDFVPRHTFRRRVARYRGDYGVRRFNCWQQFLAMLFAQLTYRESLRDIEACLRASPEKAYHMGFTGPVSRSTLAEANENRDWRIYADFAHVMISEARRLYAGEPLDVELDQTVYALDASTIDLSLSLFPWATFRTTKAAVKLHTLLDLRGNIPAFIWITNGRTHDVRALDVLLPEPGAIYVLDRGFVDFKRLQRLHDAHAVFVTRAKRGLCYRRRYSAPCDHAHGILSDQTILLTGTSTRKHYHAPLRRIRYRDRPRLRKNTCLSHKRLCLARPNDCCSLQKPLEGRALVQVDQTTSPHQGVLRNLRQCCKDANLDRNFGLRPSSHRPQAPRNRERSLHNPTGVERLRFRESPVGSTTYGTHLPVQLRRRL
jgi:Domain of unknown function (DUF4372)/Transposase DDE domain